MTPETIHLVERVRSKLSESERPCEIAGPIPESAISAAEEALGVTFPPSYRKFLRTFGGIAIPAHLGVVHEFVGVTPPGRDPSARLGAPGDVVGRTLAARAERKLAEHLVVVGLGAQSQSQEEWFCLDVSRPRSNGECPVFLYDPRDNALDQEFYKDFGEMLEEVMGFVADNLDQPLD
ncbi:MAG TPA: SMI1/KNR4 family protein [Kofleriaceae bacterium]|nr:SMI1/KNR4 family protein [Kofleriaceae bacterium]